jgi:hypothetical protein
MSDEAAWLLALPCWMAVLAASMSLEATDRLSLDSWLSPLVASMAAAL